MAGQDNRGWSGERELEWKPIPDIYDSGEGHRAPPPSPRRSWKDKLKEKLSRGWDVLPSAWAWLVFVMWVGLALLNIHVGGAFLTGVLETGLQVWLVMVLLTVGVPLLVAPRFDASPIGWGVFFNVLGVLSSVLLVRYTGEALSAHGTWQVHWLEQSGRKGLELKVARGVASTAGWGYGMISPELMDGVLKPLDPRSAQAPRLAPEPDVATPFPELSGEELRTQARLLGEYVRADRIRYGLEPLGVQDALSGLAQRRAEQALKAKQEAGAAPMGEQGLEEVRVMAPPAKKLGKLLMDVMQHTPPVRDVIRSADAELSGYGVGIACEDKQCYGVVVMKR